MAEALTSLREDHKLQTHNRIVDAAAALIYEEGENGVTMASVAKRAAISERTVYRHFKNRGALIGSVWERLPEEILRAPVPDNGNELIDAPLAAFPRYDEERKLIGAYLDSGHSRKNQGRVSGKHQSAMMECLRDHLPDLGEDQLRRRAAIAELLISADAWDWMGRVWGFDGVEAGDAACEALEVLLGLFPAEDLAG